MLLSHLLLRLQSAQLILCHISVSITRTNIGLVWWGRIFALPVTFGEVSYIIFWVFTWTVLRPSSHYCSSSPLRFGCISVPLGCLFFLSQFQISLTENSVSFSFVPHETLNVSLTLHYVMWHWNCLFKKMELIYSVFSNDCL